MQPTDTTAVRADPGRSRSLRRSRDVDADARRRARRGCARHRSRRTLLHRLRGRDRLPEHGSPARRDRRGDQGAGRPLPAPVLHDRRLRAVRRGLQAPRRAVAVRRRRAALDPRELRCRGDRERRQDRALGNGSLGGRRLRQRVPRPHASRDDDDEQGEAVQGGLRAVRSRGLSRAELRTRTTGSPPTTRSPRSSTSSRPTSTPRPSRASSSSPSRARGASSRCRPTTRRSCRSSAASTGSSGCRTRCSREWGAPGRCGRSSSTPASSRT